MIIELDDYFQSHFRSVDDDIMFDVNSKYVSIKQSWTSETHGLLLKWCHNNFDLNYNNCYRIYTINSPIGETRVYFKKGFEVDLVEFRLTWL